VAEKSDLPQKIRYWNNYKPLKVKMPWTYEYLHTFSGGCHSASASVSSLNLFCVSELLVEFGLHHIFFIIKFHLSTTEDPLLNVALSSDCAATWTGQNPLSSSASRYLYLEGPGPDSQPGILRLLQCLSIIKISNLNYVLGVRVEISCIQRRVVKLTNVSKNMLPPSSESKSKMEDNSYL
jgi:hypothetical protein